ncbi:MAG TPA: peptidoglycan DD-metalloendopeptidase family protein [Thermoanaerobaculia bacterium]|jgi:murein DD-endopeptidase MepM/ murein hydrolase activator NlpD
MKRILRYLVTGPRAFLAVAIPIALPLLVATVSLQPSASPSVTSELTRASLLTPKLSYSDLQKTESATLPAHADVLTMEDGDTLDSVLVAGGLTSPETATLTRQIGQSVDLRRLRPGNLVRFHRDEGAVIDSVEFKVVGWGEVDALRAGDHFDVTPHVAETREVETTISATIDRSLYEALRSAGENPQLVQQLVDVFQWDIDFFALKKGDAFTLVVKKRYSGNDLVGYGPIAAARFLHDGDMYEAFRHDSPDGRAGYYARNGTPLRKQFLRAPLQFTRITSGFSKSRYHPLLHYFRPHHGVDYGAPVGTPVMTTADGVVVETGYNHGEGNFIRVRHTSRIETMYLHLSRFGKNIRRGKQVTQGDVIGYVGMTGLATGPHLDYRVKDGDNWLDPLQLKSITPDPLRGDQLAAFRANVSRLSARIASSAAQVIKVASNRRALF